MFYILFTHRRRRHAATVPWLSAPRTRRCHPRPVSCQCRPAWKTRSPCTEPRVPRVVQARKRQVRWTTVHPQLTDGREHGRNSSTVAMSSLRGGRSSLSHGWRGFACSRQREHEASEARLGLPHIDARGRPVARAEPSGGGDKNSARSWLWPGPQKMSFRCILLEPS